MHGSITYDYLFVFSNGKELQYKVEIDPQTLLSRPLANTKPPPWAELKCERCPNCTLSQEVQFCPVAEKIAPIFSDWNNIKGDESVYLTVFAGQRTISGHTTAKSGLVSFLGLLIASSDCPHTRFLAPMCRTHLPLASTDESLFRMASYYIMAKFFSRESERELGGMEDLAYLYRNLQDINTHLGKRVRWYQNGDASVNAITMLYAISTTLPTSIEKSINQLQAHVLPVSDQLDGASVSARLQSLQALSF